MISSSCKKNFDFCRSNSTLRGLFIAKLQVWYALGLKPVRTAQNPNQGVKEPMARSGSARRVLFPAEDYGNSSSSEVTESDDENTGVWERIALSP